MLNINASPLVSTYFSLSVYRASLLFVVASILIGQACTPSSGNDSFPAPQAQTLPVVAIKALPATTYQEFSASLQGSRDIEIRPQVGGYIERIYVDEGARVSKGQTLFQINSRPYVEQLNTAKATLAAARAALATAEINVNKLTPLVQHAVISDVQLKTAQASYDAARANVSQAQAMVQQAQINVSYATIKAPANGYIGRIPFKTGSLAGPTAAEPLTVLSETEKVYAYFSLSENEFIDFKNRFAGATVEEKLKQLPPVELVLADNSVYPQKGRVEIVSGQFSHSTGSISYRASFPNTNGLLRSGNTGKIRIPRSLDSALVVPQEATFELQDRVLVFILSDSNKVAGVPIHIAGKSGNYYLVDAGVKAGQKIVYSGLDRLQDGAVIEPRLISMDSLVQVRPL